MKKYKEEQQQEKRQREHLCFFQYKESSHFQLMQYLINTPNSPISHCYKELSHSAACRITWDESLFSFLLHSLQSHEFEASHR